MRSGALSMAEAKALAGQPETERRETLEALPTLTKAERKAQLRQQMVRPAAATPDDEPEEDRADDDNFGCTARDIAERLFAVLSRIGVVGLEPADANLLTADEWQGSHFLRTDVAREIDARLSRLEAALLEGEAPAAWWRFNGESGILHRNRRSGSRAVNSGATGSLS